MHVIAKPVLIAFWTEHPDAESALQARHRLVESESFTDFNQLRATFGSADHVDGLTVFNIGGNKYRLIAAIHYNCRKLYVRAVLTRTECDRNTWRRKK